MKRSMKNYAYLFLAAVSVFSACVKEVIPMPVPAQGNLTVFSDNFNLEVLLYKMDPATGDTFMEAWCVEGLPGQPDSTCLPYLQRLGKDGKLKWNQWVPITRKPGLLWVNETVYDITTDGSVIDGVNVVDDNGLCQVFITKINPDGTYAWGNEGKLFYDFGERAIYQVPCESFVAADNEGGAWIAAGNGQETLVFARVDSDGNFVVEPIVFSSRDGTGEDKEMLRRPQMFVGPDNSLIALIQYGNAIGGGGSSPILIDGYYDVVKIPADGNVEKITQNNLISGSEIFNPGMRVTLTEDGKGGAYACFVYGVDVLHAYLYHFDSDANVDVKGVNLYPSGSWDVTLSLSAALDSKTNNLVILIHDSMADDYGRGYSVVNLQIADLSGNLKYEEDGKNIFSTDPNDTMYAQMGYFTPATDGRFIFTFFVSKFRKSTFLYQSRVDIGKEEIQDVEELTEIDIPLSSFIDTESRMMVTDGVLRHLWFEDGKAIYGYDVKIK